MTDRQAAEARELAAEMRDVLAMSPLEVAGEQQILALCDAVDALSVRLAQAEESVVWQWQRAENAGASLRDVETRLRVADALLREYEEALDAIARNAEGWHSGEDGKAGALNVIATWARDPGSIPSGVLAASGDTDD